MKKQTMKNFRMYAVTIVVLAALAASAVPKTQSGKTSVIHSRFTLPSNPRQGRDPFFPNSNRPYEIAATAHPRVNDISSLVVKGFSGKPPHRLVIINNYTFAVGDEGDVVTPAGRIHLRCIAIKKNSVVIEVGNQEHELFYSNKI